MSGEPTTLVVPAEAAAANAPGGGILPGVIGGGVLVVVGLVVVWVLRRRRRLPPAEAAFRSLSHQMGLSRSQAGRVRRYARARGLAGPVAVVMSRELLAEALDGGGERLAGNG
ncbi:MAG: hypothetical protein WD114_00880 [Phycisphaerales bacterium]